MFGELAVVFDCAGVEGREEGCDKVLDFDGGGVSGEEEEGYVWDEVCGAFDVGETLVDSGAREDALVGEEDHDEL